MKRRALTWGTACIGKVFNVRELTAKDVVARTCGSAISSVLLDLPGVTTPVTSVIIA